MCAIVEKIAFPATLKCNFEKPLWNHLQCIHEYFYYENTFRRMIPLFSILGNIGGEVYENVGLLKGGLP